ncbi:MAG: hypothetical protein J5I52_06435 [Saprospiraceae bacterium]|nr:MAG: hypothetical protein UZ09_BCD002001801 [Bacteroidetes bacterium OLB9]MCO6463772.1 hypothetical protein [Saprospiraceae bacterium]MCZ2338157.1 hypothetical protein [Chitinophagales bacterium]
MNYKDFEKYIADQLGNQSTPLDVDQLIRDIHGEDRKNRKAGFWWVASFIALALISSMGWLFLNAKTPGTLDDHTSKSAITITDNHKNTASQNAATILSSVHSSESVINHENATHLPTASISTPSQKKVRSYLNTSHTTTVEVLEKSEGPTPSAVSHPATDYVPAQTISETTHNLEALSSLPLSSIQSQQAAKLLLGPGDIVCPDFSLHSGWALEIVPEIGAFYPDKRLEYRAPGEQSNVFLLRNQKEKSLEGLNAGLYFHLKKKKWPVYLKAGISWSKLTEKMPLDYSYEVTDTTRGIISITYSQTGDTITTIYGDIYTQKKVSGKKVRHYQMTLWDLPIGLGFEKNMGNWFIAGEAGVNINLSMSASGSILASDTSFTEINASDITFRKNLGLSWFGGLNFGRYLGPADRIYLSARVRYIPGSFSRADHPIQQFYMFEGLHLGYIHRF